MILCIDQLKQVCDETPTGKHSKLASNKKQVLFSGRIGKRGLINPSNAMLSLPSPFLALRAEYLFTRLVSSQQHKSSRL